MLIDTHCHLDNNEYKDLDNVISDILNSDVKKIIVSGYDVKSSNEAIALAHKHDNIYVTVGFHPECCMDINESDYLMFDEWLSDDKVVGIGEIGLDYHYCGDKDKQIEIFKRQIEIAVKYNKPVVVHNREASDDVYNLLKDHKVKGVIHCFNDSLEVANKFVDLGFFLGIGGIITFKKNNLVDVLASIPLEYIVLETDSPYLSPEPFRGRINSPLNLPLIAEAVSKIKNISYDKVAKITTKNASDLFDLHSDL